MSHIPVRRGIVLSRKQVADYLDREIPNDEPEEGDLITHDHSRFYEDGRLVLTVDPNASSREMWREIHALMKAQQFYPNVWFVSDHGNAHLMSSPSHALTTSPSRKHRRK